MVLAKANSFAKRTHWSEQTPSSNNTSDNSTHGDHQMVNTKIRLIVFFSQRWRSSIQSAKTRPGADWGSDHEDLIAKFRRKLKKVGKTSRHDLYQTPYDYTVKVTNIQEIRSDRVPEELWTEVCDIV